MNNEDYNDGHPFFQDPKWPRTDTAPNLSDYRDRAKSPKFKMEKLHKKVLTAQS